jgi:cytochrome c oxidase subunit 2
MFTPGGPQAERILDLWWVVLAVCAFVFAAVLAALLIALWKGHRGDAFHASPKAGGDRRALVVVTSAVGVSAVLLVFLIIVSAATDRLLAKLPAEDALTIELIGHRWWWEARYQDPQPSLQFSTANELHIPVGRPVRLKLRSSDVIHSFWVPNLHGKKDLIPGRDGELVLRADKAGTYRGQCAEFCGTQHANMAFLVHAEPPEQYEAWAAQQRKSAPPPADERQKRGRELFVKGTCASCHTVHGTPANGRKAPDLTHVGSRRMIAAGALPNRPENIRAWIRDPHQAKPGVNMPSHSKLTDDELEALASFLSALK